MQTPSILLLLSSLPLLIASPYQSLHPYPISLSTHNSPTSFSTHNSPTSLSTHISPTLLSTHISPTSLSTHKPHTSSSTPKYHTSPTTPSHPSPTSTSTPKSFCPPRPASPAEQRAIFADFVYLLYTLRTPTAAFDAHVAIDLIEHDPFDAQGRDANAARLETIIPHADFTVLRSGLDNDIGFIHVRIEEVPQPAALADLYRLNGSCIVEHWDIVQYRPANATNPIAFF